MRSTRRAVLGWCFLAVLLVCPPAAPASQSEAGADRGADEGPRYSLSLSGIPDSVVFAEAGTVGALDRLWTRKDLTTLAERARDRYVVLGRYDATVRLTIVEGSGSTPGRAALSLIATPPPGAAAGGAAPPAPQGPNRSLAVVRSGGGEEMPDAQRAFDRGSRGAATPAAIAAGVAAIRDEAVASGRYAAKVAVDSVVAADGVARVYLTVAPGPPVVIEALEIPGATTTRPSAAEAISGLRAGRVVTPTLLAEGQERLVGSDLFATVGNPRILPGREPGRARIVIPVEEMNTSRFEGALGVAKGGGVTGLIDLALGNIGGTGRSAGARWAGLGDGRATYALGYREPALLGRPIDGSLSLDAEVADSLFTQTRWALAFGGRPAARTRAALALAHTGSVYSGYGRGSSETWSVEGRVDRQGMLPQSNPTRGVSAGLQVEVGSRRESYPGLPEARRPLTRGAASLAAAAPLGGRRVLYGALRAEQVSLGGADFPAEELLYLGGSEGLRGHRDRAFAGNRIYGFNIEQRWLTDSKGGRAYIFLDGARHALDAPLSSGVVAAPGASTTLARTELSDGWELGYGAGIKTPVASGVAGLELGLSPGAALREATIHVRYASRW
jgi:hypothetical protein